MRGTRPAAGVHPARRRASPAISPPSSSSTNSGNPSARACKSADTELGTAPPSRAAASLTTSSWSSRPSSSHRIAPRLASSRNDNRGADGSSSRTVPTSSRRSVPTFSARYSTKASDSGSAHCRSSKPSNTPRAPASSRNSRNTASARKTSSGAASLVRSNHPGSTCANAGAKLRKLVSGTARARSPPASASATARNGAWPAPDAARPRNTSIPAPRARSDASLSNRDLPTPASPATTSADPPPSRDPTAARSSTPSSSSRATNTSGTSSTTPE